jgi:hypothetical protein
VVAPRRFRERELAGRLPQSLLPGQHAGALDDQPRQVLELERLVAEAVLARDLLEDVPGPRHLTRPAGCKIARLPDVEVLDQVGDRRGRLVECLRADRDLEQLALASEVAQLLLAGLGGDELLAMLALHPRPGLKRVALAHQEAALGVVLDAVEALQVGQEAEPHLRLDRVHRRRLARRLGHHPLDGGG